MPGKIVIKPIREGVRDYLRHHQLEGKFEKAMRLLEHDIRHPSLDVEILKPKHFKVYSFRIDQKFRALFIFDGNKVEILSVSNHYK